MSDTPDTPIIVNSNPLPGQAKALLRQALIALGAWAVGKGYVDAATATNAVPIIIALVGIAWGQYSTFAKHKITVVAAEAAPNTVAKVQ